MDNSEQLFSNLVREHKSTIYTVCYMFSKDNDEVADLFQEILIKLWKGFQSFEGRSDIKNTCISLDRKKKRRKKSDSLAMDINLYDDNDSDTRQVKQLYERINRLGVFDRAIILLWLEGIPYDEIADIVGISTKNVSVKLYRIREQLKNMK